MSFPGHRESRSHTRIQFETEAREYPGPLPTIEMNSATRDNIFANKERLHRLTQKTRGETGGEMGQQHIEKEKARQEARALEERRYLRQHNKTVTRVLSQAAKAADPLRLSSEDKEEDEESEEDSDADDQLEHSQKPREKTGFSGEPRKETGDAERYTDNSSTRTSNKGKRGVS